MKTKIFQFCLAFSFVYFLGSCNSESDILDVKSSNSLNSSTKPLTPLKPAEKEALIKNLFFKNSDGFPVAHVKFHWSKESKVNKFHVNFRCPKTGKTETYLCKLDDIGSDSYKIGDISISKMSKKGVFHTMKHYPFLEKGDDFYSYVFKEPFFDGYNFKEFMKNEKDRIVSSNFCKDRIFGKHKFMKADYTYGEYSYLQHLKVSENDKYNMCLLLLAGSGESEVANPFASMDPFIMSFLNGFIALHHHFDYSIPMELDKKHENLNFLLLSSIFFNTSQNYPKDIKYSLKVSKNIYHCDDCYDKKDVVGFVDNYVNSTDYIEYDKLKYPTKVNQKVSVCMDKESCMNSIDITYKFPK